MRISDWSSDVCSSDLHRPSRRAPRKAGMMTLETPTSGGRRPILRLRGWQDEPNGENERTSESISAGPPRLRLKKSRSNNRNRIVCSERSEEHTSELQSLMRNSYAVLCLKKKKQKNTN